MTLALGFSVIPPASPWGINFGGGLNSTAVMIECRERGHKPDWILFANTGSERPETYAHVERMTKWADGWCPVTVVRWERQQAPVGFEALHDNCLRTEAFPSKAYGYAGCTGKWKSQPMDAWREANGFQRGAYAIGYDADENRRIKKACLRGDDPNMVAWYPLVAWGVGRFDCDRICRKAGFAEVAKSSCFMCPNMKEAEWAELRDAHPRLFSIALEIERKARARGEKPQDGMNRETAGFFFDDEIRASILAQPNAGQSSFLDGVTDDRCHHGGCFT